MMEDRIWSPLQKEDRSFGGCADWLVFGSGELTVEVGRVHDLCIRDFRWWVIWGW
jgi:hypothetical protein